LKDFYMRFLFFAGPNPAPDFERWEGLSQEMRVSASALGYTENLWNADAPSPLKAMLTTLFARILVMGSWAALLVGAGITLFLAKAIWDVNVEDRQRFERVGVSKEERRRLRLFIVEREGATSDILSAAGPEGTSLIAGKFRVSEAAHAPATFDIRQWLPR
jgi:hypothetical protein